MRRIRRFFRRSPLNVNPFNSNVIIRNAHLSAAGTRERLTPIRWRAGFQLGWFAPALEAAILSDDATGEVLTVWFVPPTTRRKLQVTYLNAQLNRAHGNAFPSVMNVSVGTNSRRGMHTVANRDAPSVLSITFEQVDIAFTTVDDAMNVITSQWCGDVTLDAKGSLTLTLNELDR